jgi:glycosyltransferase involved in cell wall biosynthesis
MENGEPNIMLLSHEYPPYIFGGVATFSQQIAEQLSEKGYKVFVIAGKVSLSKKLSIERKNNITIARVYFPEIPPRWMHYSFVAKPLVNTLLNKYKIKAVISNSPLTYLTLDGLEAAKKLPVITLNHGSPYSLLSFFKYVDFKELKNASPEELIYYSEAPLIKYLTRKDFIVSNHCVFVAKHIIPEYKMLYNDIYDELKRKSTVIYPGIEYEYLTKMRESFERTEKDGIVIGYVGRLFYAKGIVYAIKALESLVRNNDYKDVELWVFGRGPLENWLKHYIMKKKLTEYVKYFNFVPRSMLLKLLAKYVDILLHPSLYEGAPISVMEAQALGIPVVTFDFPWVQEFISQGINGYKVPYPNIEHLSKSLIMATHIDPEKIMRTAKRYNRKITIKIFENLLIKTINLI